MTGNEQCGSMEARSAHAVVVDGAARSRFGRWIGIVTAIVALAAYVPPAAGQASFEYTFEMPGQPALQDLHAVVHMDSTGKLEATLDYENRDDLSPFCGGIVIGVYTADGTLLQVFTTPIRCTPAMGANGNNPGQPWRRHFTWSARVREDYVPKARIIDVRAVATGDVKVITETQAREALQKRTSVVSTF